MMGLVGLGGDAKGFYGRGLYGEEGGRKGEVLWERSFVMRGSEGGRFFLLAEGRGCRVGVD